ncbi:MAG: hypothetical protein SFU91_13815 [Chloroherpetonaceae bacterium]|nr:hypothetical protein [Chloroherpetonaceae bacterium]
MPNAFFKKLFALILFTFSISDSGLAQQGSIYSRFGLGDIRYMPNSRTSGMGFAGSSFDDSLYINRLNPASLAFITSTRFSGDFTYNGYQATTGTSSSYQVMAGFEGLGFAVPVGPAAISTGLYPYSSMSYFYSDRRNFNPLNLPDSSVAYDYWDKGRGGLNLIPVAFGVTVFDNPSIGRVNLGLSYNFVFGLLERTVENLFPQTDEIGIRTGLLNSRRINEDRINGQTFTIGLHAVSPTGWLSEKGTVLFSFAFTTASTMSVRNLQSSVYWLPTSPTRGVNSLTVDTVSTSDGEINLPSSLLFAFGYKTARFGIGLDAQFQNWSSFTFSGNDVSYARNSYRIGAGIEFFPSTEFRSTFFEKMAYRAGVFYNQTEMGFSGGAVNEMGFTAGVSLPLQNEISRADINFLLGTRGVAENGFLKETIFRVTLSLNFGEKWFIERTIE